MSLLVEAVEKAKAELGENAPSIALLERAMFHARPKVSGPARPMMLEQLDALRAASASTPTGGQSFGRDVVDSLIATIDCDRATSERFREQLQAATTAIAKARQLMRAGRKNGPPSGQFVAAAYKALDWRNR